MSAVVVDVLLRARRRSASTGTGRVERRRAASRGRSGRSAGSAGSRDSWASKRGMKKLAGLQEQRAEHARVAALGVQHGQPAEARAHADERAGDRDARRERGQRRRGQRARRSARRPSTTRRGRRARAARPGAAAARRRRSPTAAKRVSPASASYSGPSWATSSGSGSPGRRPRGSTARPRPRRRARARATASVVAAPGYARGVEPRAAACSRGARAPTSRRTRPGARRGFAGSQHPLGRRRRGRDLELVLEPRHARAGRARAPLAVAGG